MIATTDTGKFEISIAEMNVEFAPGIGKMKLKYKLGDSTKVLMEKYPDEDFLTKMFVFDKSGQKLYESEKEATVSGEFVWDGYFGNNNKDSLVYKNGPFKLSLALTNADSSINNWQDFKDWAYEVFLGDSINTFTTGCDTSFNILNDPIKLDWIANSDEFSDLIEGNTSDWYESFVENWKEEGFFANENAKPLEWLKDHEVKNTSVKFVNATVENIIKEFGMVIHAADSILKTDNPTLYSSINTKYSGKHSGLNIRFISNSNNPSNHSIGAAVDFRVPQNPMLTSENKKHTEFIKYITYVDLLKPKTAETVTTAHKTFMEKFHSSNFGNTTGKHDEILAKYLFIDNYDKKGKIKLAEIEKINKNDVYFEDFQNNRETLITALENHKSTIVFEEASKRGIDKLIGHLNAVINDTVPMLNDDDIQAFFTERNSFMNAVKNMGFTDLKGFHDYFKNTRPFNNLLFEHGFCDNDLEVYDAFNKAHKMVSKKLIGKELNIEWGGIYSSRIDGMHFSLNKELIIELTSKK